ncbi:hypothetical protein VNO78_21735 [Psophocarpus tetragonolobus]|uniref:Uncharacterized protein n=1 Tax=Psophocarpus tetragonolobus TaxID=3891 RepID=A0AAN9SC46_PSOTE
MDWWQRSQFHSLQLGPSHLSVEIGQNEENKYIVAPIRQHLGELPLDLMFPHGSQYPFDNPWGSLLMYSPSLGVPMYRLGSSSQHAAKHGNVDLNTLFDNIELPDSPNE